MAFAGQILVSPKIVGFKTRFKEPSISMNDCWPCEMDRHGMVVFDFESFFAELLIFLSRFSSNNSPAICIGI